MVDHDAIEQEFRRTLTDVRNSHPKYAFDRDGRPGAIAAVRGALPTIERELFGAVVDDFECELAATREALFQMVAALKS